jgi:hypothetical protein
MTISPLMFREWLAGSDIFWNFKIEKAGDDPAFCMLNLFFLIRFLMIIIFFVAPMRLIF